MSKKILNGVRFLIDWREFPKMFMILYNKRRQKVIFSVMYITDLYG
jgi:hypothetical protein